MSDALPPRDFVVFDTETTGPPPGARLIEIGALHVKGRNVVSTFHALVDPEGPIPEESSRVHGLYDADLRGAPTALEVLPRFLEWAGRRPLVAHNVAFDARMLASECRRLGLPLPVNPALCTLQAARRILPRARSHALGALVQELGLPEGRHHRAEEDAWHALRLFWHLEQVGGAAFRRSTLGPGRPVASYAPEEVQLPPERAILQEAAERGLSVDLDYALPGRRLIPARVRPRFFYRRQARLLMEAWCHESGFYKTYRVDRVVRARLCPGLAP